MAIKRYAPAVEVIERDESEFVQNPRQLYAGFVGYFNQGPVNTPVLVDNEQTLVQNFGKPDNKNYEFWFTASSYLAYSGSLYVVRVKPTGATNATTGFRPLGYEAIEGTTSYDDTLFNYDDFSMKDDFDTVHGVFAARETGKRGDSLAVYVCQGKEAWELDLKIAFDKDATYGTFDDDNDPETVKVDRKIQNLPDLNSVNKVSEDLEYTGITKIPLARGLDELKAGHRILIGNNTLLEVVSNILPEFDSSNVLTKNGKIKFKYISGDSLVFTSGEEFNLLVGEVGSIQTPAAFDLNVKRVWRMRNYFSGAPTTSLFAQRLTGSEEIYDEIHVAVVDDGGEYSDVPGTVLERFDGLSVARNAQNDAGDSIFWESYINENSQYIYVINSPAENDAASYVGDYKIPISADSTTGVFDISKVANSPFSTDSSYSLKKLWEAIGDNNSTSAKFTFTYRDADGTADNTAGSAAVLKEYTGVNTLTLTAADGTTLDIEFVSTNDNQMQVVITNTDFKEQGADNLWITISDDRGSIAWNFDKKAIKWNTNVTDVEREFDGLNYPTALHFLGGADGENRSADVDKGKGNKTDLRTGPGVEDAFDVLKNKKELDINLILSGPLNSRKQATLIDVAEGRYDSVVFLSPERMNGTKDFIAMKDNEKLEHILDWKGNNLRSSSYTFVDNNWKQVYDRYNSRTRWVPCNGDMAGIVSSLNEPWLSPAGLTNGFIRNALSIAYNPSDAHQDKLYQSSVNSIIRKQGQGLVLWGDRTGQGKDSAFRSINIRMLFLVIEKALAKYSETLVFDLIDEDVMTLARMNINSYLKTIQSRGGIQAFNVIMDESNNTPYTIDSQQLHAEIRIDATRTINNILLTFVATNTGAAFTVNG